MSDIEEDRYHDIRPYRDEEVRQVLERLGQSFELHRALVSYRFARYPPWSQWLLARIVGWQLRRHFAPMTTVDAFQGWLKDWVTALIDSTTSQVDIYGLDNLNPAQSYLWLSNHRDIAMDPTLVGYALVSSGWPTARIAIGDNLLANPVLADLMRLNKSFIVKRSVTDRRARLKEFQKLSGYIRHSLEGGHSVWLAQREGRAKDNLDHTDTAVLKMLSLSGRDDRLSFSETMRRLRPVPVLVQYEWDPCDVLKARELVALEERGHYQKADGEDTHSILLGMKGQKGNIRICFGSPLTDAEMEDAALMAEATDRKINQMKTLFPVNYAALGLLQGEYQLYQNIEW
ncbi:MAG: 1-acyl-sn-glycerol-3-phosphate acyltransferase, partial [Pseudomonadota bacterium]|nr:1-acyl-sn-glycerol-3-phosphate acyltransferase [Pseudomonadota bacterium]